MKNKIKELCMKIQLIDVELQITKKNRKEKARKNKRKIRARKKKHREKVQAMNHAVRTKNYLYRNEESPGYKFLFRCSGFIRRLPEKIKTQTYKEHKNLFGRDCLIDQANEILCEDE